MNAFECFGKRGEGFLKISEIRDFGGCAFGGKGSSLVEQSLYERVGDEGLQCRLYYGLPFRWFEGDDRV